MAHGRSGEAGLPQSSPLIKFPMRPKKSPKGTSGATKSANIERHHDKHSQQTAMRTHSALPNREDLKGMGQVPRRLIKKTVAQPAAQHNAKNAPEKKVLNIVGRHAPPIILRSSTTEEPESEKTQKVHQTVPMHSQRTDRERDGIKLRMNQHAATTATFL